MRHQIRPIRVAIAGLAIAALAACSGTSTGGQAVATGQTAAGSAAPGPVAVVTASPALGDQQRAPAEPGTISVAKAWGPTERDIVAAKKKAAEKKAIADKKPDKPKAGETSAVA